MRELRGGIAAGRDELGEGGFCLRRGGCVPDGAQLGADALADREARRVMDGVPGEVELAALPCRAAEPGPAGGAQAGVVVGDHVFDPAQAAGLEALRKGPPTDLRLGEGDRDAEHPAALVRADADSAAASRTIPPWRIFS